MANAEVIRIRREPGEVRAAVRLACWAARDLGLLGPAEFERFANQTIEQMSARDLQKLAEITRNLAAVLDRESRARP